MTLLRVIIVVLLAFLPSVVFAQNRPTYILDQRDVGIKAIQEAQKQRDGEILPPVEPDINPVTFLKIEEPRSLQERVERLLLGVYTDIPPEYDHYGYEMRRYMAHVAGPQVLGNPERLQEELQNIRKAKIILDYWDEALSREMHAIEKEIEDNIVEVSVNTTFQYNRGIVNTFLVECRIWLDKNEAVLQFLLEKQGSYTYQDPVFTFAKTADKLRFRSLYQARQKAYSAIVKHIPFAGMVY